ncbi:MAG TPA: hypothetical protein VH352_09080, partial [Pseudonocardiaceae bacterium]|nr:hypothetical protein [Pseudonocardiaceae bacterium]
MPNGAVGAATGAQVAAQIAEINQQAVQMQSSAKGFVAAAGTGFHIEPEAAAILIKSCQDSLEELRHLDMHIATIAMAPLLGTTPGAKVISPFTQRVATDEQGMLPAIESLKKTLADMITAYRKASTNYAETEAIIAQSLKS